MKLSLLSLLLDNRKRNQVCVCEEPKFFEFYLIGEIFEEMQKTNVHNFLLKLLIHKINSFNSVRLFFVT